MQKRFQSEPKTQKQTIKRKIKSENKTRKEKEKDKIVFSIIADDYIGTCIPFTILNDKYRQIIKCSQGVWDPIYKIWRIPKQNLTVVRSQVPLVKPEIPIEDPPQLVNKSLKDPSDVLKLVKVNKVITYDPIDKLRNIQDNPLYPVMYPFQRKTLQLSIYRYGRLMIADDMGVGKTLQALACAIQYIQQWPLLIICPSALKLIWFDQICKWLGNVIKKQQIQVISKSGVGIKISQIKIVIISYELATRSIDIFNEFKVVIADEAHYLKNTHAQRTQNLAPFLTSRKRIFLITGTPSFAKPRQIYNLISIIRPDIYHSIRQFGERYCILQRNPWTGYLEYQDKRNVAELFYILQNRSMIRRLKKEVLNQLPEKQRQTIMIETDKSISKEIRQLLKNQNIYIDSIRINQKAIQEGLQGANKNNSSLTKCYQLTGIAKLDGVKQYLKQIMQNQVKMLIFAYHKVVLDQLETYLKLIKCSSVRIDGNMNHELRQKRVRAFQSESDINAAILSITCASVGYTLTSASIVIFAQLHWAPSVMLQAEDRAHRIGQRSCVNAHYLVGENTLDQIFYRSLERKLGIVGQLMKTSIQLQENNIRKINKVINHYNQQKQVDHATLHLTQQKIKKEDIQKSMNLVQEKTIKKQPLQNQIFQEQEMDEEQRIDRIIRKRREQFYRSNL